MPAYIATRLGGNQPLPTELDGAELEAAAAAILAAHGGPPVAESPVTTTAPDAPAPDEE